ncbi:MAG: hypothetical protein PHU06_14140, partial [Gallionella sp.]|nr:hypothetical protein [Gallionella sp.]MDD4960225.1 hypothetical protein [Gallionella sp.]
AFVYRFEPCHAASTFVLSRSEIMADRGAIFWGNLGFSTASTIKVEGWRVFETVKVFIKITRKCNK